MNRLIQMNNNKCERIVWLIGREEVTSAVQPHLMTEYKRPYLREAAIDSLLQALK